MVYGVQGTLTVSHTRLTGFELVSKLLWFSNIFSKMLLINVFHITLVRPSVIPAWKLPHEFKALPLFIVNAVSAFLKQLSIFCDYH